MVYFTKIELEKIKKVIGGIVKCLKYHYFMELKYQ